MLKIKSKFGLPLGNFSECPENANNPAKDDTKIAEVKKALMSCHRCLIYLGDLARYKGMFGDSDSTDCEYAAASSYYKEAASIFPSSGNPHHQLAMLACYSSNEVVAVYRYFQSLAADAPFSTARSNLILAFEKASGVHTQGINEKTWQDFHFFEPAEQNIVQNYQQRNQQIGQVAEQEPAKPILSGRYLV